MTPGTDFDWYMPNVMLTQDASVETTTEANGTAVTLTRGTTTGAAVGLSADTNNGCINLTFTRPTGSSDNWDVTAIVGPSNLTQ